MDDFDTQIQSEETHDHNPDERCSECGCRVIDCVCFADVCSQCGSDIHGCRCGYNHQDEGWWLDMNDDNPVTGFDY